MFLNEDGALGDLEEGAAFMQQVGLATAALQQQAESVGDPALTITGIAARYPQLMDHLFSELQLEDAGVTVTGETARFAVP